LLPLTANAGVLDLTTAGNTGTINGAIYTQGTVLSGTGVYPSFVEIQSNGSTTSAYNTTVNNVLNNGSSSVHNHEIRLSDVPVFTLNGINYYSFRLDVNESTGNGDNFVSLDQLQFYTSTTPNQSTTNVSTLGTLRYNLDGGTNSTILLDYALESGSGTDDMEALIPQSAFAGALQTDFVYLFSAFGGAGLNPAGGPPGNYATSDGFEEWALGRGTPGSVPEPGSLAILGSTLAMLGGVVWWRRRRGGRKALPQGLTA
jgi:hypothetical protein